MFEVLFFSIEIKCCKDTKTHYNKPITTLSQTVNSTIPITHGLSYDTLTSK